MDRRQNKARNRRTPAFLESAPPPSRSPRRPESDVGSVRDGPDSADEADVEFRDSSASPDPQPGSRCRQPMKIINWRGELCRLLDLDLEASDEVVLSELDTAEALLEEAKRLSPGASEPEQLTPRPQAVYRIHCHQNRGRRKLYLNEPWISESSSSHLSHLRADNAIRNFELFLERGKDISFLVYKDFECCVEKEASWTNARYDDPDAEISAHFLGESISIVSEELSLALQQLADQALSGIPHPNFDTGSEKGMSYPYLWWFHRRQEISQAQAWLDAASQLHIEALGSFFRSRLGSEWNIIDSLIQRGRISAQYIEYLFVPGTIVVSKLQGFIGSTHWTFDGDFHKSEQVLRIAVPPGREDFNITDLSIYPIGFADDRLKTALRARGEMYWRCRRQRYIRYTSDRAMQNTEDQRFMIDIRIYKQMHPSEPDDSDEEAAVSRQALGPRQMSQDDPSALGDNFLMCLPTTIPGFNMQKKEWANLEVYNIRDVEWNREAFDLLVADKETKDLVRALVDNHCNIEKSTDLIQGKGNGLFILLHGAPGTGKTLTAETVAEIAERPLYRVTCGDIGTKAEDVEKYLETVMLLGKTWGCVVLLDEADVFLEERTLFDLQRNALVSVFLRVLEYYDGILILTSNRVCIFDEAFKSRIQLTLRYKNLEEPQRKTIWGTFISRLEQHHQARPTPPDAHRRRRGKEHAIDADEIRSNIGELAKAELNGRQIRNAVSTARQLAMFRDEPMRYEHLKIVIEETAKFDSYLKEVTGLPADVIQRDRRVR
ncbi:hypothetical protein CDD83_2673 [Cordyceps sp. RAO-2017]|nr:hypothetical protein CDD83_2673 [Cordyceps sp. RAO-2017]